MLSGLRWTLPGQAVLALVVGCADARFALAILHQVHESPPNLHVVVRTVNAKDIQRLKDAGVAEVVPEILDGSLMLAAQTLMCISLSSIGSRVEIAKRALSATGSSTRSVMPLAAHRPHCNLSLDRRARLRLATAEIKLLQE